MRYLFGRGVNEIINENGEGLVIYDENYEKFFYNIGQKNQDETRYSHHKDDLSYSSDIHLYESSFKPFYARYKIKNSQITMFKKENILFLILDIKDDLYIKANSDMATELSGTYKIEDRFYTNIDNLGKLDKKKYVIQVSESNNFISLKREELDILENDIRKELKEDDQLIVNPIFYNISYSERLENKFYIPICKSWMEMLANAINKGGDYEPTIFAWDNTFASIVLLEYDLDLAFESFKGILESQQEDGRIPQFRIGDKVSNRTNPPVWFIFLEKLHEKSKKYAEEVYDSLYMNYLWFKENRMNNDYTFSWGVDNEDDKTLSIIPGKVGAIMETGLDDSPIFHFEMELENNKLNAACIDLSSLIYNAAEILLKIGIDLGIEEEKLLLLKEDLQIYSRTIHSFCNFEIPNSYRDGESLKEITPLSFYPMLTDLLNQDEVVKLEKLFYSEHFDGEYKLYSLSSKSKYFDPDGDYWKGRVWPPMNYLVFLGLKKHSPKLAEELANISYLMSKKEWEKDNHIHENYSGLTGYGEAQENKFARSGYFYNWGSLMALMKKELEGEIDE